MYTTKILQQQDEWEIFVKKQIFTLTTQSWHFGEFYKSRGDDFFVLGVYDGGTLIAGSLVLVVHARRGTFLFLPYGPILSHDKQTCFSILLDELKKQAKKYKANFIRISPFIETSDIKMQTILQKEHFKKAPLHMLAEHTHMLDLTKNDDKLLMDMKKNHRNLIRRCEREGVRIEISKNRQDLQKFHNMIDFTAQRHNFTRFSNDYVEKEFDAFTKSGEVLIFCAYLPDGTLDSTAVIYYYGSMSAYRHGSSLIQNPKLPTSYLLQWRAIQEAKRRGMQYYNFWGIAPDDAPKNHPFKGITHFKKGFGGKTYDLIPAHDYIITNKYYINWIIEEFRRRKRGF